MREGPLGTGLQEQVPNHLRRLCAKSKVVNAEGKGLARTRSHKFDFLGYTFRPRRSKNRKGKHFINFSPAVSNKSAQAMRDTIRGWNLPKRSDKAIDDLSHMFNPII
jgi:RNA-directed DNA polymerase